MFNQLLLYIKVIINQLSPSTQVNLNNKKSVTACITNKWTSRHFTTDAHHCSATFGYKSLHWYYFRTACQLEKCSFSGSRNLFSYILGFVFIEFPRGNPQFFQPFFTCNTFGLAVVENLCNFFSFHLGNFVLMT